MNSFFARVGRARDIVRRAFLRSSHHVLLSCSGKSAKRARHAFLLFVGKEEVTGLVTHSSSVVRDEFCHVLFFHEQEEVVEEERGTGLITCSFVRGESLNSV